MKTMLAENISEKYLGHIFNFFIAAHQPICILNELKRDLPARKKSWLTF